VQNVKNLGSSPTKTKRVISCVRKEIRRKLFQPDVLSLFEGGSNPALTDQGTER